MRAKSGYFQTDIDSGQKEPENVLFREYTMRGNTWSLNPKEYKL